MQVRRLHTAAPAQSMKPPLAAEVLIKFTPRIGPRFTEALHSSHQVGFVMKGEGSLTSSLEHSRSDGSPGKGQKTLKDMPPSSIFAVLVFSS